MVALPAYVGSSSEARLLSLGLRSQWLIDAVIASEIERQGCHPLEPSGSPGYKAWVALYTNLAQTLVHEGWRPVEDYNLPRIVHPRTAMAIAVCHGNERVGLEGPDPKSKYPRGDASKLLVRSNQRQLLLFDGDPSRLPLPPSEEQITWWLLVHSSPEVVRAELSLPVALEESHLSKWQERIIIDLPAMKGSQVPPAEEDDQPPFDVAVRIRQK